ncbi:MAG: lytic murein transglycosylase [bacterium]
MSLKTKIKNIFGKIFIFLFVFQLFFSFSFFLPSAQSQTNQEKIQQKQQELSQVERKISDLGKSIEKKNGEVKTLQREIDILGGNIEKTDLELEKTRISIEQVNLDIENVQKDIEGKEAVIFRQKNDIKEFVRLVYESDNTTVLEMLLSGKNLTDFWSDLESVQNVQKKIQDALEDIKIEKFDLETNKIALEKKQGELDFLFAMHESQKSALESDKEYKNKIVKKANEKKIELQNNFQDAQKMKDVLREEIFSLKSAGVSMSMQEALDMARFASSKTGVRAEFLLGLLKVESDLGNNVGSGNYKKDMSSDQRDAFVLIVKKLGLNPDTTPVSKKPTNYKGWGGAMGPAQMMPKTWLGYEAEIASLTGHNPPSPWDIKDAFVAAALRLARTGAASKTREGEFKAAMMYLAGSNWDNPKLAWYGERVLKLAERYGS